MISGILMLSCMTAFPCGYPDPVEPQWHWFFYTGHNCSYNEWQGKLNEAFREENITFWHNRVKGKVSREEVETALYDLYILNNQTDNKFFRYLYDHNDKEALGYCAKARA